MGKLIYRTLTLAFAIPIGVVSRRALDRAWRGTQGGDPPHDPQSPNARFTDVLAWAGLSALAVASARFLASRGAAVAYRALTGRTAPGYAEPATRELPPAASPRAARRPARRGCRAR
ncbi:MAG: DUF4235 domain-containing protein [Actinobacteria bacterium]|nr:DUF4235 domain-containing protein [Actinomycetota bacterium]MBI3685998.1 DUF4235 domain-containing protein [Actinomycetota bacterium]